MTAGLSTCYDLRFPELYRAPARRGGQGVRHPGRVAAARVAHWTLLAHARAIENQCVVIACNTAGTHSRTEMGGHSQVVLPTGEAVAVAGLGEQVLSVDVDLSVVDSWRADFPVLADRRLSRPCALTSGRCGSGPPSSAAAAGSTPAATT